MKKCTKTIGKIAAVSLLFLLVSLTLQAQNIISGKISNASGIGIPGVTVTVKGTNVSTTTDADGAYSINAPKANSRLVITSIGYSALDIAASAGSNIVLIQSSTQLDDIVVVAYGSKKKSDLTGAVTSVSQKDFQKGNINSSEQLLQGKVAGLEVTTGGGSAGGGSKIRIRGTSSLSASNDPLIVIDGVPVEGNGLAGSPNLLSTINPNDIESMSVLKDASAAALYGSRATNGVIIITTKKGASKQWKYNFNTLASRSERIGEVDVLSADQIRSIVNGFGDARYTGLLGNAKTDWQEQIYQKAFGYDNNISASGIADLGEGATLPIRVSLGYLNQEGILKTNTFDRTSASVNLNPKFFNNYLTFNISAKYSHSESRFADGGAIGGAVAFDPTQPVYSGNSKYGGYYEWLDGNGAPGALAPRNPLALLELRNNQSKVDRFIGNVQMDYKMHFLPDLHLLVNLGIDQGTGRGRDIQDSTSASSFLGNKAQGKVNPYKEKKRSTLADVQLFYEKSLPSIKSKFDILVGHGFQDFYTDNFNFRSKFQNNIIDPQSIPVFATGRNGFAIESYIGRLNYSLNDKYLITASIRRDASSKFSKENRVGYFPAVSAAWKLREEFFRGSRAVSELKLRGGYGITGQQDGISNNSYQPLYFLGSQSAQYQFGNTFTQVLRPVGYDPNVKWEETETINVGLDFGFVRNRITGTVDVYQKKTTDLLSVVPVAPGANFGIDLLKNVGNLTNKGVELALNFIPVQTNNVTWSIGGNAAYNETEITKLQDFVDPGYKGIAVSGISGGTGNNIGRFAVGYAPYTFYPQKQVYAKDGSPIEGLYEDAVRDGAINDQDRSYYKKPAPDVILGFNTSVSINKFTLGVTGHGQIGNYLYNNFVSNNGTLRNIQNPLLNLGNAPASYLDTKFANNQYLSDLYIENASFFRMDNINLGYNFGKIGNGNTALRLSASAQNIFVITKYSGYDPENASSSGVDNNIYPRPRIYSVGASLDF